jgi:hypothetical protein
MLKEYVVLFVDPVDPVMVEGFLCEAEDQMHVSEQATDAYPEYQVVWIEEGTDWAKAQENYLAYHLTNSL